ncbi:MAG: hypothetical protein QUS08_09885, partial [Methanothrix sp.]|nr:hypothetical protein [Methanothrix sp.]
WTARASDPERDPILYRFWLKGPSTGDAWKVVQDWSTKSQWVWTSSPADSGAYTVYVYARDGRHSGAGGYDSAIGAAYLLLKSSNQPPKIVSLQPDRPSPQEAGAAVRWTARASDPERDPILYRFWLKGPSTGDAWKVVQDWSTKSQWTWASAPSDVGSYGVYVYARDGKHAGPGGYDSAAGQTYALQAPKADRLLSQSGASGSMPSLEYTGDGYLLAYQSWDPATGDDILLQKFDPDWNALKSSWVSKSRANESSPSLASAGGYHYVAYVSMEKGNRDIFLKKYDGNLRLVDSMQLTSSPTEQDSPSLIAVGDEFYLAYQTWDTGSESGGDIAITRYDRNWNPVASALLTDDGFYQDRPSLAFSSKSPYVAYVSRETGNLDVFVKRLDQGLKVLETRRMTSDRSDQDYPDLGWHNGQFILLYASKKAGNYDIVLDRYSDDWRPVDSMVAVAGTGDQTEPSLTYSTAARAYWLAYTSRGAEEKYSARVYLRSLQLPGPS